MKIAVPQVKMPDGSILGRTILEIDATTKRLLHLSPLTHEEPFTEWHDATAYIEKKSLIVTLKPQH